MHITLGGLGSSALLDVLADLMYDEVRLIGLSIRVRDGALNASFEVPPESLEGVAGGLVYVAETLRAMGRALDHITEATREDLLTLLDRGCRKTLDCSGSAFLERLRRGEGLNDQVATWLTVLGRGLLDTEPRPPS